MRALALAALSLVATGAAASAPGVRVWCLGDSITVRYAHALAARRPDWTVVDLGLGGERSDEGRARLDRLLARVEPLPAVAIVIYGANDIVAGRLDHRPGHGPAQAAENLHAIAARLRDAGIVPIVALPVGAPPPSPTDDPEAHAKLLALRRGFAELRRALHREHPRVDFRLTDKALFVDAVHPSPAGGAALAARAEAAVERALRVGFRH
jgi:lysophospholipase L1-like esterase